MASKSLLEIRRKRKYERTEWPRDINACEKILQDYGLKYYPWDYLGVLKMTETPSAVKIVGAMVNDSDTFCSERDRNTVRDTVNDSNIFSQQDRNTVGVAVNDSESLLTPDRFQLYVKALRTALRESSIINGIVMFDKPELARKTCQVIRKFAELCEGIVVVNQNREARQNVADFFFLTLVKHSGWQKRRHTHQTC